MMKPGRVIVLVMLAMTLVSGVAAAQTKAQFVTVSKSNPNYLSYSDGSPFIPVGPNICWPRFESEEKEILQKMQGYLDSLSKYKGNYTRIWLSAPQFEVEHAKAGVYDEAVATRIDKIVDMATKRGIKIKFCFENFRSLTGYPAAFKGSVPFDRPVYHKDNGGPLTSMDEFFESEAGRKLYINRMTFFSNRYKNNTTILGWELWNEMNAVRVSDPQILVRWTSDMLKEAKRLFPNQLVMQSLGSFDNEKTGAQYSEFSKMQGNELAQVHRYIDPGASLEICKGPMDLLAADATNVLRGYNAAKPVIVSEVGAVQAKHAGPSQLYLNDKQGMLLHDLLFAPFFSGAAAPGQSWHWFEYIEKNNLWWHFAAATKALEGINPVDEQFVPSVRMEGNLRIYTLTGRNTILIWCRDAENTWQNELEKGIAPAAQENKTLVIDGKRSSAVSYYNIWTGKAGKLPVEDGKVKLPAFSRSVMIRVVILN